MELEFKQGDIVHFKGYDAKPIRAKVIEAKMETRYPSEDIEPIYQLEGAEFPTKGLGSHGNRSLVTRTSGRCIVESKYFKDCGGDDWDAKYYEPLAEKYKHLIEGSELK